MRRCARCWCSGRNRLRHAAALLESFSYQKVLQRGFAIVQDARGSVVTKVATLRPGQRVAIRFADGTAPATIDGGRSATRPSPRPARRDDGSQGTLL